MTFSLSAGGAPETKVEEEALLKDLKQVFEKHRKSVSVARWRGSETGEVFIIG